MKRILLLLLLFLAGCSLNADQESALNSALTAYTTARNNGQVMSYVAYTYPNVVSFYKDQGDSSFVLKFGSSDDIDDYSFIQDGNIKDIESSDNTIHVKYSFLQIDDLYFGAEGKEVFLFAISEDDGVNWYFMDQEDYLNEKIISSDQRLIK